MTEKEVIQFKGKAEKEFRGLKREIDGLHDSAEDSLVALQTQYEAITEQIAPLESKRREIESLMDKIKHSIHSKRLEYAAKVKEHLEILEKLNTTEETKIA